MSGKKISLKKQIRKKEKARAAPIELTFKQRVDLLLGKEWSTGSPFPSREARKAAWFAHKDTFALDGWTRPSAWWTYEAPGQRLLLWEGETVQTGPGYLHDEWESDVCALCRMGIATPEEQENFAQWHEDTFTGDGLEELLESEPWTKAQYLHERSILGK